MFEIIIIICLALIFGILLRRWPETKPVLSEEKVIEPELSDIDFLSEGEGHFENKNYQEAEKYYLKAATKDPDNALIYGRLGVIYFQQKNFKDAQAAFKTAIRLNPENGFYQNNLGLILFNLKRYKEALLYFENAVDLDEKDATRWVNLGLCYDKLGKTEKALQSFKKAVELEPKNKKYIILLEEAKEKRENEMSKLSR